ncbi:MAG: hypothetical protein IPJ84_14190 [Bdellovibrionales bacterium]|nr:hypothetical protein [Bdellovibrionales bacterium]
MRTLLVAIAMLLEFSAEANSPRVHNLAPLFVQFWQKAKDKPLGDQIKEFDRTVYPSFPRFYDYKFKRWAQIGKTKEEGLQKAFTEYSGLSQKFEEKTASIANEISLNLPLFLNRFPDFNTDFDISIIHSLGEMDDGTRTTSHFFGMISQPIWIQLTRRSIRSTFCSLLRTRAFRSAPVTT